MAVNIFIYKITNNINNKIYVGRTNNLKLRWKQHKFAKSNSLIYKAIQKYGYKNFTFEKLESCYDYNCCDREQFWMDKFKSYNKKIGYNIANKAEGYFSGKRTLEHCKNISKSLKGKSPSKESRLKMSKARLGRFKGKEHPLTYKIGQYDKQGNFIKSYNCIRECSEETGILRTAINNNILGRSKSSGGFIWKKL